MISIKYIIDRIEGPYAICEDEKKTIVNIPICKLPLEASEGDCILKTENDIYLIDSETTEKRNNYIREKLNRLFI